MLCQNGRQGTGGCSLTGPAGKDEGGYAVDRFVAAGRVERDGGILRIFPVRENGIVLCRFRSFFFLFLGRMLFIDCYDGNRFERFFGMCDHMLGSV